MQELSKLIYRNSLSSYSGTLSAHIQELSKLTYKVFQLIDRNNLYSNTGAHIQELTQHIYRNSLSSDTGTLFVHIQELSQLIYRNSLSSYTGALLAHI